MQCFALSSWDQVLDFSSRWLPGLQFIRGTYAVIRDMILPDQVEPAHVIEVLPLLWETGSLQIHLPRFIGKSPVLSRIGRTVKGPTFNLKSFSVGLLHSTSLSWKHILQSLDSSAANNFMDLSLSKNLKIPLVKLEPPLTVTPLDGTPLGNGSVYYLTTSVHLSINNHQKKLQFHLIHSPEFPIVLGFQWLSCHNPHIDWSTGSVLQ